MAEEAKITAAIVSGEPLNESEVSNAAQPNETIETSKPLADKKPSEMTEEEKKERLAEIKRQMKAQTSATIVKETWGGDRESASVTSTTAKTNSDTTTGASKKTAKFSDSGTVSSTSTVSVSMAGATRFGGGGSTRSKL